MFSNGLPFPLAGGSVPSEPGVAVESASCVGPGLDSCALRLGDRGGDESAPAELIAPTIVDVTISPVLTPVGPITIGTRISSVLPSASILVSVAVVLVSLIESSLSLLSSVVVCRGALVIVDDWASRVVVGDGSTVFVAAA
jgi:hypothetical protein